MPPKDLSLRWFEALLVEGLEENIPLRDLFVSPPRLLQLIPEGLRTILLISGDYSRVFRYREFQGIMAAICLYRLCSALLADDGGMATGYFLICLRILTADPEHGNAKNLGETLKISGEEEGKLKRRFIEGRVLPVLREIRGRRFDKNEAAKFRDSQWMKAGKSLAYKQYNLALGQLFQDLKKMFPEMQKYLDHDPLQEQNRHTPAVSHGILEKFLSNDGLMRRAAEVLAVFPRGEIEDRAWFLFLHPTVFCHLSNRRLARRALKSIVLWPEVYQIELDLLRRQRRFLLALLRGVLPDPAGFLDRSLGALLLKKMLSDSAEESVIPITERDLAGLPDGAPVFHRLSRGVFFFDTDSSRILLDRRSAMFQAAYALDGLSPEEDGDLPVLPSHLYDIYSFTGFIAVRNGQQSRLIRRCRSLAEGSRPECRIQDLLIAGQLLKYSGMNPHAPDCSAVHKRIVHALAALWDGGASSSDLDQAAKILNILDRPLLGRLLDRDMKKILAGATSDMRVIGRYAFHEGSHAWEAVKTVIDRMPDETINGAALFWTIEQFNSPYRENLFFDLAAADAPWQRSDCLHKISVSNSLPSIRRLAQVGSFIPQPYPGFPRKVARRIFKRHSSSARMALIEPQYVKSQHNHPARTPFFIARKLAAFTKAYEQSPESPIEAYRACPIALGRDLINLLMESRLCFRQECSLLAQLDNSLFWPLLDRLLPLHERFLKESTRTGLSNLYKKALLGMSHRNNAYLLEKELAGADTMEYQVLLLHCLGRAHGLGVDDLFERFLADEHVQLAVAAVEGLAASIGLEAGERLFAVAQSVQRGEVREAAYLALGQMRSPLAIPEWIGRLRQNPKDHTAHRILIGYGLPETEKEVVDAIWGMPSDDRDKYYWGLLVSGGPIAMKGFRELFGPDPDDLLPDDLGGLNPESVVKASEFWFSLAGEKSPNWQMAVIRVIRRSRDPRAIMVLMKFAYESAIPEVSRAALHALKLVEYTQFPNSIELVKIYEAQERSAQKGKDQDCGISTALCSAYVASFYRRHMPIPRRYREYLEDYISVEEALERRLENM